MRPDPIMPGQFTFSAFTNPHNKRFRLTIALAAILTLSIIWLNYSYVVSKTPEFSARRKPVGYANPWEVQAIGSNRQHEGKWNLRKPAESNVELYKRAKQTGSEVELNQRSQMESKDADASQKDLQNDELEDTNQESQRTAVASNSRNVALERPSFKLNDHQNAAAANRQNNFQITPPEIEQDYQRLAATSNRIKAAQQKRPGSNTEDNQSAAAASRQNNFQISPPYTNLENQRSAAASKSIDIALNKRSSFNLEDLDDNQSAVAASRQNNFQISPPHTNLDNQQLGAASNSIAVAQKKRLSSDTENNQSVANRQNNFQISLPGTNQDDQRVAEALDEIKVTQQKRPSSSSGDNQSEAAPSRPNDAQKSLPGTNHDNRRAAVIGIPSVVPMSPRFTPARKMPAGYGGKADSRGVHIISQQEVERNFRKPTNLEVDNETESENTVDTQNDSQPDELNDTNQDNQSVVSASNAISVSQKERSSFDTEDNQIREPPGKSTNLRNDRSDTNQDNRRAAVIGHPLSNSLQSTGQKRPVGYGENAGSWGIQASRQNESKKNWRNPTQVEVEKKTESGDTDDTQSDSQKDELGDTNQDNQQPAAASKKVNDTQMIRRTSNAEDSKSPEALRRQDSAQNSPPDTDHDNQRQRPAPSNTENRQSDNQNDGQEN